MGADDKAISDKEELRRQLTPPQKGDAAMNPPLEGVPGYHSRNSKMFCIVSVICFIVSFSFMLKAAVNNNFTDCERGFLDGHVYWMDPAVAYENHTTNHTSQDCRRWMDRTDLYQPQAVAIDNRFFNQFGWHELDRTNLINNCSDRHSGITGEKCVESRHHFPFTNLQCLCQNRDYRNKPKFGAGWTRYETLSPKNVTYCDAAADMAALHFQAKVGPEGAGTPRAQFPACTFKVPYPAVLAMFATSFLGFVAVGYYAKMVLQEPRGSVQMHDLGERIAESSLVFLKSEYQWLAPFVLLTFLFIFVAVDGQPSGATPMKAQWRPDYSISFLFGAILSSACGYMGMHIATQGNVRTACACALGGCEDGAGGNQAYNGMKRGLQVAFRSGACMGIGIVSFGMFGLATTYMIFGNVAAMGGFSFGASAVALFARVGGGIYTKAADVGGDLCGKVEASLDEDNPKNPATIADCVGDNVGDTAGMGADLFESFVGAVVAACVLGAAEFGEKGVGFPMWLTVIGLLNSILCTIWVHIPAPEKGHVAGLEDLLWALTINVIVAIVLIVGETVALSLVFFHDEANYLEDVGADYEQKQPGARIWASVTLGLLAGFLIGKVTEYFTSHTDQPTRSIARSAEYGPGPVVIQGIGMGMYSTAIPMSLIVTTILGSYYLAGLYGVSLACVGMLSTLGVTMSTDAYGPVSDNAGGIAEMCELPDWVRRTTDELDALGNTTAATGKGFSNGSAVLAAISLLAAYARMANISHLNLLEPVVVVGILLGCLQPYIFAAMTMLSVNKAAQEMMAEVRAQFRELNDEAGRNILHPEYNGPLPDYDRCIQISTNSALKEMLLPGLLAVASPLIIGFTFGSHSLGGFLLGAIASGYLLGVQMSNTGGAWDNAKKYVEKGDLKLKGVVRLKKSLEHAAVVAGDTVGDPLKDTSGPSLNILIKLMTGFSFVVAELLDAYWGNFWIGIVLFCGTAIVAILVKTIVLKKEEVADEYYYQGEGIAEQLDFIDGADRRMRNEMEKISKQKDLLSKEIVTIRQMKEDTFSKWKTKKMQQQGAQDVEGIGAKEGKATD